jgi:tryptophan synthase beta chain
MIAVEPASCPTLTKGKFAYDFGDTGKMTPLMKMYTLGSSFMPNPIHAGGLRYHGISSIISQLYHDKIIEAVSYKQSEIFEAALLFAKEEGILPAPESSHSIKHAIIEAKKGENAGKNIIFVVSGTGFFDLTGYRKYLENEMKDVALTDEELQEGFKSIPNF